MAGECRITVEALLAADVYENVQELNKKRGENMGRVGALKSAEGVLAMLSSR